jgi:hypothetical protein
MTDKKEETCVVSGCKIADLGHTGVRCLSGHHVCEDCTEGFVQHVLGDIGNLYKCLAVGCAAEIVPLSFERQLKPKQLPAWYTYIALKDRSAAKQGEAIYSCPRVDCQADDGGWLCLMDAFMPRTFFSCDKCAARGRDGESCTYCKQVLQVPDGGETPRTFGRLLNSRVRHFGPAFGEGASSGGGGGGGEDADFCEALGPHLLVFLKAVADSAQPACPHCGHRGRKDDACTHMCCPKCTEHWCYCCGAKAEEADGSGPGRRFGEHNAHFEEADPAYAKRCPQFLSYLDQIANDPAWAGIDGDAATDKFHECVGRWGGWRSPPLRSMWPLLTPTLPLPSLPTLTRPCAGGLSSATWRPGTATWGGTRRPACQRSAGPAASCWTSTTGCWRTFPPWLPRALPRPTLPPLTRWPRPCTCAGGGVGRGEREGEEGAPPARDKKI